MEKNKRVAIVIPYYNGMSYLLRCVGSLKIHTPESVIILIIDNASDQPAEFEDMRIKVIRNAENLGFTKAINQGIKLYPSHDIIPFNSDAEATTGWFGPLVNCVYSNSKVALACPRHLTGGGDSSINQRTSPKPFFDNNGYRIMHWAGFTCVYIRNDAIGDVGLLNEKYFHYSSDEDWCKRARKKGWSILWAKKSKIKHVGMVSFSILKKKNPKLVQLKIDRKFKG